MTENDRLEADLWVRLIAVFAGKHVDLALVQAELRDVGLEEEDISVAKKERG